MKCPFRKTVKEESRYEAKRCDFEDCYETDCAAWGIVGIDFDTNLPVYGCMMTRNNVYACNPGFGSCA